MKKELICIVCPQGCRLQVENIDGEYVVTGNTCKRGVTYAVNEVTAPRRVITTTVKLEGSSYKRLPVKTDGDVPKELIFECMEEINKVSVKAPVKMNDVVLENVLGTGVNVVSGRDM